MIELSIVIPAYNETDRIGPMLDALIGWMGDRPGYEIVVVDDGSTDGTAAAVAERLEGIDTAHVIVLPENRGKGHAVRTGMLAASGRLRMFLDADGSTPVEEIDHLVGALDAIGGHGIAFGSIASGTAGGRAQVWLRSLSGRIGNWLTQQLVLPRVRDTQRGCKVMSDCVAETVFPLCVVDGWGFDVEVLALARLLGYPLAEVPVRWSHVDGGHVTMWSYLSTLRDLLRIRRRIRSGAYGITGGATMSSAHLHEQLAHPGAPTVTEDTPSPSC